MAFTDFTDKTILEAWGLGKLTLAAACIKGDLLHYDGQLADANSSPERSFDFVALESGASGATINVASQALLQAPSTIAAGGVVTAGTHSGAADERIWLSATAGRGGSAAVASLAQIVGFCVGTQRFIFNSNLSRWSNAELITGTKTLDIQDIGKVMVCTVAAVVTLPAVATGHTFLVVNGADDGALVTISPNSSDQIKGPDYGGTDNKDWENTAATSKTGDLLKVQYESAAGYTVTEIVGVWTQES